MDQSSSIANFLSSPKITLYSMLYTTPLYKNERFLRQKYEFEGLSARQIAVLISCSHDAVNRALERFRIAKSNAKTGPIPYGWKLCKGKRIPHKREQKIIQQMKTLRRRGWSLRKIADHLNENAISISSGSGVWHASSVERILSRKSNNSDYTCCN